jgi:hypothetical protein
MTGYKWIFATLFYKYNVPAYVQCTIHEYTDKPRIKVWYLLTCTGLAPSLKLYLCGNANYFIDKAKQGDRLHTFTWVHSKKPAAVCLIGSEYTWTRIWNSSWSDHMYFTALSQLSILLQSLSSSYTSKYLFDQTGICYFVDTVGWFLNVMEFGWHKALVPG